MSDPVDVLDDEDVMDALGAEKRTPQGARDRGTRPAPEPEGIRYDPLSGAHLDELWRRNQQPIDAVATPYPTWNRVCGGKGGRVGLARGWNVLFAAPPGTMKSIFACNLAAHAAMQGESVAFHSLEMDWDDNAIRTVAIATRTPVYRLEPGAGFDRTAAANASRAMDEMRRRSGGSIWVNRGQVGNLSQLEDSIRRRTDKGARYHIVDYMQLIGVGSGQWNDILARVTETSYAIRMLTKELQIVSVGLSQLVRDAIRQRERPTAQDLMGGSPLENDAHQVLIYDPTRYQKDEHGWRGWIASVKNRHGDKGEDADIPIHFNRNTLVIRQRLADEVDGDERHLCQPAPAKRRNG